MEYLEWEVLELLSNVHYPNPSDEKDLLDEIVPVFSLEDNAKLLVTLEETEVKK